MEHAEGHQRERGRPQRRAEGEGQRTGGDGHEDGRRRHGRGLVEVSEWARAFALTVVVEVAVAVPLLGALGSPAGRVRRAAVVALASAVTHPVLWVAVRAVGDDDVAWTVAVLTGEVVAVAVEAVVLVVALPGAEPDRRQRVLVAVLMNAVSAAAGLLLIAVG